MTEVIFGITGEDISRVINHDTGRAQTPAGL
jgi:hypothetical protein